MSVTPQTNIRLLNNIPWGADYKHTRLFTSLSEQTSYFNSRIAVHVDQSTYQREEQALRVNHNIDSLLDANYVMFQNANFTNKWFYAFIITKRYINPNVTEIVIETDVMQTWMFDFRFNPTFIERQHCRRWNADGTPVINTQEENLAIGREYDVVHRHDMQPPQQEGVVNGMIMVSMKADLQEVINQGFPPNIPAPRPKVVQNLPMGLSAYVMPILTNVDPNTIITPNVGGNEHDGNWGGVNPDLVGGDVTRWRPAVEQELLRQQVPIGFADVILAIIMAESGGRSEETPDIMQSSESMGWPPNTITDPLQSIEIGIRAFDVALQTADQFGLSFWAAVQSYNFGPGYARWLGNTARPHSFDASMTFARNQSSGTRIGYNNPIAIAMGFNWRYMWGNMFYFLLIQNYLLTIDDIKVEEKKHAAL